jgi:AIG2-like family
MSGKASLLMCIEKIKVRVHTLDGEPLCFLYVLNGYEGGLPSKQYMSIIVDAAIAAGAPVDYLEDLAKRPTRASEI